MCYACVRSCVCVCVCACVRVCGRADATTDGSRRRRRGPRGQVGCVLVIEPPYSDFLLCSVAISDLSPQNWYKTFFGFSVFCSRRVLVW